MNCKVCTRCGKCGLYPSAPIAEAGVAALPRLVKREGLGAAVDIGSTTIVARLDELRDDVRAAVRMSGMCERGGDKDFSSVFIGAMTFGRSDRPVVMFSEGNDLDERNPALVLFME